MSQGDKKRPVRDEHTARKCYLYISAASSDYCQENNAPLIFGQHRLIS